MTSKAAADVGWMYNYVDMIESQLENMVDCLSRQELIIVILYGGNRTKYKFYHFLFLFPDSTFSNRVRRQPD